MADSIELYQLVGSALRDVAQARFMADLFSRQISFQYERDALLRRFPVPRIEIDEAELSLYFAVTGVELDPNRHTSRNAAIGGLYHQASIRIVRSGVEILRRELRRVVSDAAAVADAERRDLSEDNLELWSGRLLQYFNESTDRIFGEGNLDAERVKADLVQTAGESGIPFAPLLELKKARGELDWQTLRAETEKAVGAQVDELVAGVHSVISRYPDYRIQVQADPGAVQGAGASVSSIKIKSSVKNYTWSKVDVDKSDMRNIRTLNPQ